MDDVGDAGSGTWRKTENDEILEIHPTSEAGRKDERKKVLTVCSEEVGMCVTMF